MGSEGGVGWLATHHSTNDCILFHKPDGMRAAVEEGHSAREGTTKKCGELMSIERELIKNLREYIKGFERWWRGLKQRWLAIP